MSEVRCYETKSGTRVRLVDGLQLKDVSQRLWDGAKISTKSLFPVDPDTAGSPNVIVTRHRVFNMGM